MSSAGRLFLPVCVCCGSVAGVFIFGSVVFLEPACSFVMISGSSEESWMGVECGLGE
jgi:hypothetical protein